ncbi:MAG: sporulation integral membrane protein YlbJ [Bacillota bacterium]
MFHNKWNYLTFLIKIITILIIFVSLISYPKDVFEASLRGLNTWWTIVFPALLPFFIMSELLVALGIVNFLGILLEPVMRPLFNLPGPAAFVLAVGYTSGAPISSMVTANLRNQGLVSKNEAERIICFTNNASPLFMFGAVAVGMFNRPELGIIIAGSHYLANILLGIALRFWKRDGDYMHYNSQEKAFKRAFETLVTTQKTQIKPFGKLLGDAIKNSVHTLLLIGGFIILFSVFIELLTIFYIIEYLSLLLCFIFTPFMLDINLAQGIASGLIEMTIGSKLIIDSAAPLNLKVAAVSLVLGWSGLSIHAQALSMISNTDISFFPFIVARIFHGIMAAGLSLIIFNPAISAFSGSVFPFYNFNSFHFSLISLACFCGILIIMIICSMIFRVLNNLRFIWPFRSH